MSENNGRKPTLTDAHRQHLYGSGLTDQTIEANGLFSVSDPKKITELLGWSTPQKAAWSCLAFPFYGHDGRPQDYTRLRPDMPRKDAKGKAVKYEGPVGESNRAYFPLHTRLHLPDPAVPLFVTEGEKKALAADQNNFLCVGLVGVYGWCKKREGKGPLELIDDLAAIPWEGRVVTLVFDSDAARKREVVQAETAFALALEKAKAVVKIVRLPDGPGGQKQGFDDYLLRHGAEAFRELLKAARPVKREAKEQIPEFMPFPVVALPQPVGEFVTQGAKALGCDPAFFALIILAVLAGAIGNTRVIRVKRSWDEPCIIWSAVVAESGTLKTPAFKKVVWFLYRLQKRFIKEHAAAMIVYQEQLKEYKAAKKLAKENLDAPDPGDEPEQPICKRIITDNITIEKLAEYLETNPRGILSARDELASWFASFTQYKSGRGESDMPRWLESYCAGTWLIDRKTGEKRSYFVDPASVSVTGTIQPGTLARAMTPEFMQAGGASRLLMAMPPRRRKKWSENEISEQAEQDYHGLLEKLYRLEFDPRHQGEPHVIRLDNEAKALWVDFYDEWAGEQTNVEGEMAACYSKLEGVALRLALVHHVVSHAHHETDDTVMVGSESMLAGIDLARWFANEARRVYGMLGETKQDAKTRALVDFIRGRGGKITTKQLQNSNSRKYQTADAAEAELQGLVLDGLAVWEPPPTIDRSGGRPLCRICSLISLTPVRPSDFPTKPPQVVANGFSHPSDETTDETPQGVENPNVLEGLVGKSEGRNGYHESEKPEGAEGVSSDDKGVSSDGQIFEGEL